jgi:hypothetical protein
MVKMIVCAIVISFVSILAKPDTVIVVNCKCDTLKIVKTVDTAVTIKLDTLKTKVEKRIKK